MPALPSGTVTFLFTDIESSTRLWEQHAPTMSAALARHDAILRAAIEAHYGSIFKTSGDGVHAVFAGAPEALAAALAAQRALHAEPWGDPGALRVRMALHTGKAELRDNDYFGPPLNRIARLMAAGHGGQILLSAVTQELVRDSLPPAIELRDLGEHHLKDLSRPERIFQLVTADLPASFPPLRTLDAQSADPRYAARVSRSVPGRAEAMIRILLADDQTLIRQGIQTLLELEPDLKVVGVAGNGREALAAVEGLQPDVVLMDVRMPEMDGVAATRALAERFPEIGVIILTTFDDDEYIFEGLKAGARGYLLKDVGSDDLAQAVRTVAAGQALIQPSIARKVVAEFSRLAAHSTRMQDEGRKIHGSTSELHPSASSPPPLLAPLTERELEVLRAIAQGLSNKEIADRLVITEGTVKNHVSNLLGKLEVRDRTQAVLKAQALKLIP